jgi:zinc transporter ZupT
MNITLLLIGIAAGVATLVGGTLALWCKERIHLILGFSAGAVIGVALFDLLPEALEIGEPFYELSTITSIVAVGFLAYLVLDRMIIIASRHTHEVEVMGGGDESGHRGHVGAGSLTLHSFLDGLGIGLAFQVSSTLGVIVAIAVLVHDFSDGINTVNLSLLGTGKDWIARRWLIADALAPLIGIGATLFFTVSEKYLAVILAVFTGFFLYIGASELLPESHHRYPRFWTSAMTVLGVAVMYIAIRLAGV